MGEPSRPTAKDRAETRELAGRIVESVRADSSMAEAMGFSRHVARYEAENIEPLLFDLAQELELQREAVAEAMVRAFYLYNGYSVGSRHVSGCLLDALDAVAPSIAAEIRDGADMHDLYQKQFGDRT